MTTGAANSPSSSPAQSTSAKNAPQPSPALHGASHAFLNASTLRDSPLSPTRGRNGAIAAAASVSVNAPAQRSTAWDSTPDESRDLNAGSAFRLTKHTVTSSHSPRIDAQQALESKEQSPSHVAALVATTLASTPKSSPKPSSRRPSPLQHSYTDAQSPVLRVDPGSTAATKSLIQIYETKQAPLPGSSNVQSVRYVTSSSPRVISPTPNRSLFDLRASNGISAAAGSENPLHREIPRPILPSTSIQDGVAGASREFAGSGTEATVVDGLDVGLRHDVPPPRRTSRMNPLPGVEYDSTGTVTPQGPEHEMEHGISQDLRAPVINPTAAHVLAKSVTPILTAGQDKNQAAHAVSPRSTSFNDPLSNPLVSKARPKLPSSRSLDGSSQSVQFASRSLETTRSSANHHLPQMSVDSLANAMVASSLASSRAASPTKTLHAFSHHQGRQHFSDFNSSQVFVSRTPSPAKVMRQTLREPANVTEVDVDSKRRGHFPRKHANKHHEGDRKRYQTQVTEHERKRYEGLWAANRGWLLPIEQGDSVLNIVVRDIWRRSRLPDGVLEEVWDLVNLQDNDRLEKDAFVVGMWLIDQRLKGNKLPYKVSENIWFSVRRLSGIKVLRNR